MNEHDTWRKERFTRGLAELKKDVGQEGVTCRMLYLEEIIASAESERITVEDKYCASIKAGEAYMERYGISLLLKRIDKVLKKARGEMNALQGRQAGITDETIKQAAEYPIEQIIHVVNKKALCPFHDDHKPSMSIKNNRYRCFSCGAAGSAIDITQKVNGIGFVEAVKFLNAK